VREVVREALADEMVFLQSAECVLKDGIVGYDAECFEEFAEVVGSFSSDTQKVSGRHEDKRRLRRSMNIRRQLDRSHRSASCWDRHPGRTPERAEMGWMPSG
jgi:hypothetical protein